jgi:hypothetical protein
MNEALEAALITGGLAAIAGLAGLAAIVLILSCIPVIVDLYLDMLDAIENFNKRDKR